MNDPKRKAIVRKYNHSDKAKETKKRFYETHSTSMEEYNRNYYMFNKGARELRNLYEAFQF